MTFISRKTRLLAPHWLDECDPAYLYQLNRKRSDGRLKRHSSCDDLRAWVNNEHLNYEYLLELMSDGENRPLLGIMGRLLPVECILDILCGLGSGGNRGGGRTGRNKLTPEDVLRIVKAAMLKLNCIDSIVNSDEEACQAREGDKVGVESDDQRCDANPLSGVEDGTTASAAGTITRSQFTEEYNKAIEKIACLRQRLNAIQAKREELNTKMELSKRMSKCSSGGSQVKELYSREDQEQFKKRQKKLEKLIAEKGYVLNEMCQTLKNLNELKRKFQASEADNKEPHANGAPRGIRPALETDFPETFICDENCIRSICTCPHRDGGEGKDKQSEPPKDKAKKRVKKGEDEQESEPKKVEEPAEGPAKSPERKKGNPSRVSFFSRNSKSSAKDGNNGDNSSGKSYRKTPPADHPPEDPLPANDLDSITYQSCESLEQSESQRTYNISFDDSPVNRRSKSDTSLGQIAEDMRSYEQRLSDLTALEDQIRKMKKNATLACYFKKKWLKSCARERSRKVATRENTNAEVKELCAENCELKKKLQRLATRSEREQKEIQQLKCSQQQLAEMEDEMTELKKELNMYQMGYQSQRDCISRMENTISLQKSKIEKLMSHISKLCRVTEKLREAEKATKKSVQRSRSYGPEKIGSRRCMNGKRNPGGMSLGEDKAQNARCHCHENRPDRPVSECGRRMPYSENDSSCHQQAYTRGPCRN